MAGGKDVNYYDDRYRDSGTEQKESTTQVLGIVGIITAVLNLCCCGVLAVVPIALGIIDILEKRKRDKVSACGIISVILGSIELLVFTGCIIITVIIPVMTFGSLTNTFDYSQPALMF